MSCEDDIFARANAGVQGLTPYTPGKPIQELERELGISDSIKLASNENPLGASAQAASAAQDAIKDIARYPDGGGFRLKKALSEHLQIAPECITLGNGSNDVLDLIARVFIGPGRNAVFSQHAFAVYPISTLASGGQCRSVPAVDYGHDLATMLAAITDNTGVVFIANPNNPTGTWRSENSLRDFLEYVPANVIVVIDEAYFEYVDEADYPDSTQWLQEYPNLVVTRTFSKAYGLASLRIGYALSSPTVADLLNRVRQPFNANSVALAAAEAALGDQEFLRNSAEHNRQGMQQLVNSIKQLGLEYIPSVGNFIAVNVRDAGRVNTGLLQRGVIVRPIENYDMPGFIRVSVGLPAENERFATALAELV